MDSKEYSEKITSGQIGIDITKKSLNISQYQELEACPECGGELLLEKQKSKPYKRTQHKLKCEYCDYYKIQEPFGEKYRRVQNTLNDIKQ